MFVPGGLNLKLPNKVNLTMAVRLIGFFIGCAETFLNFITHFNRSSARFGTATSRLVHSWDIKRIYSYSRVFPIGGEWGAYSPAVFGRFGRFLVFGRFGVSAVLGGHVTHV